MKATRPPDRRRAANAVLARLLAHRTGYVPAWGGQVGDAALAVMTSHAAFLSYLWARLDAAADKNKLALLGELGIDSLPPAAARAPVAFEPLAGSGNAEAPAGSLVGATGLDGEQLTFRTEHAVGLTAGRLADVRSVVPSRDTTGDHTAEIAGGREVRLFTSQTPTARYVFIGHDQCLAVAGHAEIRVELDLSTVASESLEVVWSIWDGDIWRQFQTDVQVVDGSDGFRRSGTITLTSDGIEAAPMTVHGIESYWLRCELTTRLTRVDVTLPEIDQIRLAVALGSPLSPVQFPVEKAVALGQTIDVSAPFFPFGQAPDRTTALHIDAPALAASGLSAGSLRGFAEVTSPTPTAAATLALEYWDGAAWQPLQASAGGGPATLVLPASANTHSFDAPFAIPQNWRSSDIAGVPGTWLRLRIQAGSYAAVLVINNVDVPVQSPPIFSDLALTVYGASPAVPPDHVVVQDGALLSEQTERARYRGDPFPPFASNPDATSALYLGFDGPLPAATLGLYFDIDSPLDEPSHEFRWERYDGRRWVAVPVSDDETAHLTRSGIIRLLWPGNRPLRSITPVAAAGSTATTISSARANTFQEGEQVFLRENETGELAQVDTISGRTITFRRELENTYQNATVSEPDLPLFGTPRTWIRARLSEGGPDPDITLRRLVHNVTWASETRTVENEILGSATGRPNEAMTTPRPPVLPGEALQVRELTGARARTDVAILERELASGGRASAIEHETDPVTGDVNGVWVDWEPRPNLLSSGPDDRHYMVDRVRGTVQFGDGQRGRIPPTGTQNVRLRRYETGGGRRGNVPAEAIDTPLSGVIAQKVWNPVAASGGADAEPAKRAIHRAPRVVRHRFQAISVADYRDLGLQASPEVFNATALLDRDDLGGRVRLVVLPASDASPPHPSAQLLEHVRQHVRSRCPAGATARLRVVAPTFVEIGVEVTVASLSADATAAVFDRVRTDLAAFLHAVSGGRDGIGWPFGATIHVARFAPRLESIKGVDYVDTFSVTRGNAIVGDRITLEGDELPTAGDIRVQLTREVTR